MAAGGMGNPLRRRRVHEEIQTYGRGKTPRGMPLDESGDLRRKKTKRRWSDELTDPPNE